VSLPIIDTVQPTVAVVIAVTIFGESVAVSTGALALTASGLLLLVAGIVVLDTSPVVHDLYRVVHGDEDTADQTGDSGSSMRPVGPICVSTSSPGQTPQS
jgi:hypothetical protein